MDTVVSPQTLDALLDEATRPQRWQSRNYFASDCGVSPTAVSLFVNGKRGLSEASFEAILEHSGWPREALEFPVLARSGDVEEKRLYVELKRLREDVNRRTDDIARVLSERRGD